MIKWRRLYYVRDGSGDFHVIRVECERMRSGWFMAESQDLIGLIVMESTERLLIDAIPKAISDLYEAVNGQPAKVTAADVEFGEISRSPP